jgi:hypothetical protein
MGVAGHVARFETPSSIATGSDIEILEGQRFALRNHLIYLAFTPLPAPPSRRRVDPST